jgi:hypothetical protein
MQGGTKQYAAVFDIICVAQRDWVSRYRVDPDRQIVSWQPLFCHVPDDGDSGRLRDTPLSFVGTLNRQWNPERVALIEGLQRRLSHCGGERRVPRTLQPFPDGAESIGRQ